MLKDTYRAAIVAGAGLLFAVSGALAQDTIAIAMSSGVNQVPTLVAQDQGYFENEGLNVELKPVARGAVAIEAVSGGSVQFAESAHTTFFSAINKGLPLVGVAVATRGYFGKLIATPENADLHSFADFKGKHVGTQVGTGMHMVLQMLLEKEGLTEEDLGVTNVRVNDMPAAMAAGGQFDAVLGWEPGMQRIVQGGYGVEVITPGQIEEMAGITYPFILSAPRDYVEANPEVVQGVVNAYAKAHKFIREHPDQAVDIYKAYLDSTGGGMDRDTVKYMMFDTDRFGGVAFTDRDMVDLVSTVDFLKRTREEMANMPEIEDSLMKEFGNKAEEAAM
jgi:NitT/TauT family transport system substrate-binding protein